MSSQNEKYIIKSNFNAVLKIELQRRNLTNSSKKTTFTDIYEEIAEHTGMTPNMIMRLKQGLAFPSIQSAYAIADYLRLDIKDIWTFEINESYVDNRKRCTHVNCTKIAFANDVCYRHYTKDKRKKVNEM